MMKLSDYIATVCIGLGMLLIHVTGNFPGAEPVQEQRSEGMQAEVMQAEGSIYLPFITDPQAALLPSPTSPSPTSPSPTSSPPTATPTLSPDGDPPVNDNSADTPSAVETQEEAVVIPSSALTKGKTLVFHDEFTAGPTPRPVNSNHWTSCFWWATDGCTIASNNELEWFQPDEVSLQAGHARLRARQRTITNLEGRTFDYTAGMLSSGRSRWELDQPIRFAFQYGYVEMRAKVPKGQGFWSSFWLMPMRHESLPEIDIVEILGHETNKALFHYHYSDTVGSRISIGNQWIGPDFSADWHTFAVDWQPDHLIWYIDGVERLRYGDASSIPHEPMYLLATLAVGGVYPGSPDASTPFPSYLEIDYIRVWSEAKQRVLTPIQSGSVNCLISPTTAVATRTLSSDDAPPYTSFLAFDGRGVITDSQAMHVVSANLILKSKANPGSGSDATQEIRLFKNAIFSQASQTLCNTSLAAGQWLGEMTATQADQRYTVALDSWYIEDSLAQPFTLAIANASSDGLFLYGADNQNYAPQLVLTLCQKCKVIYFNQISGGKLPVGQTQ